MTLELSLLLLLLMFVVTILNLITGLDEGPMKPDTKKTVRDGVCMERCME